MEGLMMTTDERLAEIRERVCAVAATATIPAPGEAETGRWEAGQEPRDDMGVATYEVRDCNGPYLVAHALSSEAAEFIAHAREDVPFLLAELERAEERIRALTVALETIASMGDGYGREAHRRIARAALAGEPSAPPVAQEET